MKLYILDNGWMECDENWITCLSSYKTKHDKNATSKWIKLPVFCILMQTENKWVLFDTGQHPEDYGKSNRCPYYFKQHQILTEQLKQLSLSPDDIHVVILSHMHDDHFGNIHLFKKAKIILSKSEYSYVKQLLNQNQTMDGAYKRATIHLPNMQLIDEDMYLYNHIKLIHLPGHSAGTMGMMVHLDSGKNMIFTSDAVDTKLNYGPPALPQHFQYNLSQYFQSIEKLRTIEKNYQAELIFGHDMQQFTKLKKAPQWYE